MYVLDIHGKYLTAKQRAICKTLEKLIHTSPSIRKIILTNADYDELNKLNKNIGLHVMLVYRGRKLERKL